MYSVFFFYFVARGLAETTIINNIVCTTADVHIWIWV